GCDPAVFAEEIASQLARAADLRSRPPSPAHSILINDPIGANAPMVSESVFSESVFTESAPEVFVPDPVDTVDEAPITFEALARFEEEPVAEEPAPAFVAAPEPVATSAHSPITFEDLVRFEERPAAADPWLSAAPPIAAEPSLESLLSIEPVIEPVFEPTIETIEDEPVEIPTPSVFDAPVRKAPGKIDDELDRLARELGFSLDAGIVLDAGILDAGIVEVQNEESAERMAAEVALVQAETEAKLAAELERVRAEAEAHRLTEMARLQANADAQREAAIAEARAAAEEETRQALASEVARVRTEAEGTVAEAVNRVKVEAEQTLSQEIGRARVDAEALRADLVRAQEEASETARALEAEVKRVRAEAEAHLKAELERIGRDAERARAADQTHAKATAEQIREAAAREARAIAEESARRTLDAEIARVRSQADTVLEAELARVRAEAQERQAVELLAIRAEMAEVRETAAEHARAAAEEARAAAEHARASARRPAEVISFPVAEAETVEEIAEVEEPVEHVPHERRDYYSLWQKVMPSAEARAEAKAEARQTEPVDDAEPEESYSYPRWIKWGIPAAASLVLVVMSSIDTIARLGSPAAPEPAPTPVVAEVIEREVVAPPESKFGTLKVESTPSGARVTLDGDNRGKTPLTLSNVTPGTHTIVLQSSAGTITRKVTVRAGKTAIASEAIFAGWLALFSPIPLNVTLNGAATSPTEDGRFMLAPGTYQIQMTNARFNFRRSESVTVRPGEVTAHTVSLPTGAVRVSVPDGTEVTVDGQPIGKAPFAELLPLVVGTHEIKGSHPELGERRAAIDVKFQETTDATLGFRP
ncbi:MAG: PEGA domain-containing protein, partial [Vicinamibacterales bacterium]|nr:PEGA domain-containing protein [Vicinamibacterales bacterium]